MVKFFYFLFFIFILIPEFLFVDLNLFFSMLENVFLQNLHNITVFSADALGSLYISTNIIQIDLLNVNNLNFVSDDFSAKVRIEVQNFLQNKNKNFTFTSLSKKETLQTLRLLSILIDNAASFEDTQLLLNEIGKLEKIFKLQFIHHIFLQDYGLEIIDFSLFERKTTSYLSVLSNFIPQFSSYQAKTNLRLSAANIEYLSNFFISQLLFIELAKFLLQKKIMTFFFMNSFLVFFMLWNLSRLATALNLIYALLHFLFFAVLSGLLIILWGASYIGFCVLLIYGAAIPVLALYIIMLVNVDLIQRLFFIEHVTSFSLREKLKRLLIMAFIIFLLFSSFRFSPFFITYDNAFLNQLTEDVFYLLLAKRYLHGLTYSYGVQNAYDLALSFRSSDIDKVASAAFAISYNELLALVFLLLVAIIVVISISTTPVEFDKHYYQVPQVDAALLTKSLDLGFTSLSSKLFYLGNLKKVFQN